MRVFVTGATGFIGQAVVRELITAGHTVLGLARSDAAAAALTQAGIAVHRGDLADAGSMAAGARACDGVIHLAFIHDFSAHAAAVATDQTAVAAMLAALEGTGKPFVIASGTALAAQAGRPSTEADPARPEISPRALTEAIVLDAAARGVRGSVMRLPPSVHGRGDHGFVPMLIRMAWEKGVAACIGDGGNRWPAVHRADAARLFRLALEQAPAGTRLHAVAEEGIAFRAIAAAIGAGLGLPVRGLAPEEAPAHFGWMARFAAIDGPAASAQTRAAFGWQPQGPGLLQDMRESGYFGDAS